MIRQKLLVIATLLAVGLVLNHSAAAQSDQPADTSTSSVTAVTFHGKIIEVNKAKKVVTIEGAGGRRLYLKADNPYNLDAAKIGEPVVARFYEVVTIRKKRPGETVPGALLKEGIATAQPGEVPNAVAGQQARVLVAVVAIDEANGTVAVKGPDGTVERVKARDPRNLKKLKVGDELVVSLARAVAISLDKETAS
jgi:hypothetical protein